MNQYTCAIQAPDSPAIKRIKEKGPKITPKLIFLYQKYAAQDKAIEDLTKAHRNTPGNYRFT